MTRLLSSLFFCFILIVLICTPTIQSSGQTSPASQSIAQTTPDSQQSPQAIPSRIPASIPTSTLPTEPDEQLLILTASGVEARSLGSISGNLLLQGRFAQALFEPEQGLLWVLQGRKLKAMLLGDKKKKLWTIVKRMPTAVFSISRKNSSSTSTGIAGKSKGISPTMLHPLTTEGTIVLYLTGKKPKLGGDFSGQGMDPYGREVAENEATKLAKRARIFHRSLKQLERAIKTQKKPLIGMLNIQFNAKHRFPSIPRWMKKRCEYESKCGRYAPFGKKYLLVISSYSCGDYCYTECLLYDPKTRKFATPFGTHNWQNVTSAPSGGSCGIYYFNSKQDSYYVRDTKQTYFCSMGKKCTTSTDRALGWTKGGIVVGTDQ